MISYFVEVKADRDITTSRQTRKGCGINYKLRGMQSEICKDNSDQTLEFIYRVWWRRRKQGYPIESQMVRHELFDRVKLRVGDSSLNCSQFAFFVRIELRSSWAQAGYRGLFTGLFEPLPGYSHYCTRRHSVCQVGRSPMAVWIIKSTSLSYCQK
jgi:hypothetical protein